MKPITKLVGNIWISFNPTSDLFAIDLLTEAGTAFLLDLSNEEDKEEFNELISFFEFKIDSIELENSTATLEIRWNTENTISFSQQSSMINNPYCNPVDIFTQNDVDEVLKILKRISKKL